MWGLINTNMISLHDLNLTSQRKDSCYLAKVRTRSSLFTTVSLSRDHAHIADYELLLYMIYPLYKMVTDNLHYQNSTL